MPGDGSLLVVLPSSSTEVTDGTFVDVFDGEGVTEAVMVIVAVGVSETTTFVEDEPVTGI
jgi:hypothetical protein